MKNLKKSIGFDLGTSKWRFYKQGLQIANFPARVDVDGKTHDRIMMNGQIADFYCVDQLLRQTIRKVQKPFLGFLYPTFNALVSVPCDVSDVSVRAFHDAMELAGARSCALVDDCFVAAAGLGLDNPNPNATSTIVNIGAGKTTITTTKGFDIVKSDTLDIAGITFDDTIQSYMLSNYQVCIDAQTAETLKKEYADFSKAFPASRPIKLKGRDKQTDAIKEISIESTEIIDCLRPDVDWIVERIVRHFENLPTAEAQKVRATGIHVVGGSVKLKGLLDLVADKVTVSPKSYSLAVDHMKIGMEKLMSDPKELFRFRTC